MSNTDETPPSGMPPSGGAKDVLPIAIEEEMQRSYLDYAMSVIVARALPDVRDGLKPVHRRILYTMFENGFTPGKPYKKSARVVGDVMGKYHPHGNLAIYDAMVRLAQPFSMRLPLIDGQGNFGSVDGDAPAAERYTEARLDKSAMALLDDLDKDTVDFQMNYSNEFLEPKVLPARFPNLLVNGSAGIAVGMATNIPPHNLGEVIDGCLALIADPELSIEQLSDIIPGPDFPTGAMILGRVAPKAALARGRGSIMLRAKTHIETIRKDREAIIVSELPYQVNKAHTIEKIAELVKEKRIEGIGDIRDESDRQGMRMVIELKRDAVADVVLNQLYRFSQLQVTFGVNMLALNRGRPELLSVRDVLSAFIDFRVEVVTRRTKYLLNKARDKAHITVGLAIAVANIDEFIHIIRSSPDPQTARERIMGRAWDAKDMAPLVALIADPRHVIASDGSIRLSEEQARAILDLRLQRLTGLGREEIGNELRALGQEIAGYLEILGSRRRLMGLIEEDLKAVREEFATPRRTEIVDVEGDVEDEDLIQREEMVVIVTHAGYIKRVPLAAYRVQARGGRGRAGIETKEEDFVTRLFVASTHAPILFFSSSGMAYLMKVWRLPISTPQGRGKALINLLPLKEGETITSVLPLPEKAAEQEDMTVMFATRSGDVRRNAIADFAQVKANGKIAMKVEPGDAIVSVQICAGTDDVLLTTKLGKCIRFAVDEVRVFKGRDSTGVRGIKLGEGDAIVSMAILRGTGATAAEARAYLKQAAVMRRAQGVEDADTVDAPVEEADDSVEETTLTPERYAALGAAEQFVLTVSANGYGKRTSAFEYRITGRGGAGIVAMKMSDRNGPVVASFPVEDSDQIMLITDQGQTIRCPVSDVRIAGRATQGVTLFRTADNEHVVSVEGIGDSEDLASASSS